MRELRAAEDRRSEDEADRIALGNKPALDDLGIDRVNGMLFDLGVSSPQLDEAERGFSYMADAPLDMRMDQSAPVTAWTVVNTWPERELVRILRDYGEERYANRIAGNIVRAREKKPVETTLELVDIIKSAMPAAIYCARLSPRTVISNYSASGFQR